MASNDEYRVVWTCLVQERDEGGEWRRLTDGCGTSIREAAAVVAGNLAHEEAVALLKAAACTEQRELVVREATGVLADAE